MDAHEWHRQERASLLRQARGGVPEPIPDSLSPTAVRPVPAPDDPQPALPDVDGGFVIASGTPAVPSVPAGLVEALVPVVLSAAPDVAARVPSVPAALLGRVSAPALPDHVGPVAAGPERLADRLLGALELGLPLLSVEPPPVLVRRLRVEVRDGTFVVLDTRGESEPARALRLVDQFAPELRDLTAGLLAGLAAQPAVTSMAAAATARSEEDLAAARGRAHLAVAVVTALVVLRATGHPVVGAGAPAVVGLALDAVLRVLPDRPLLPGHREALQELRRARYVVPRGASGTVPVHDHRFALVEGAFPDHVPDPPNGLVAAVPGGLLLRSGTGSGRVPVLLRVLDGPAEAPPPGEWTEVVELSYEAREGSASLVGPAGPGDTQLLEQTPPWPGPVRARVSARGRDAAGAERFEIALWRAPSALEDVLVAAGPLGRRLRGEPDPPVAVPARTGYAWVERTVAGDACTVTLVRGTGAAEVLTAFGADPGDPASLRELREQCGIDPWVAVLPVEGGVLAVEPNGWQGSVVPVLRLLSARGRAASTYLGGHGVRRWSFARDGEVVATFEPLGPLDVADPDVRAALDGIDLDSPLDVTGGGLVAVGRFAGFAMTARDVARMEAADVAYRILPRLPELYREERLPDGTRRWGGHGPLGTDTDRLALRSDDELRDLAWWAAGAAAEHAGRAGDAPVRATLSDRVLHLDAEHAARASGLDGGSDHQMWLALHHATNPDALAAAIQTIDRARWVFGPDAADFLDRVRNRLGLPPTGDGS